MSLFSSNSWLPVGSTGFLGISQFLISEWSSALFHGADHIGYELGKVYFKNYSIKNVWDR